MIKKSVIFGFIICLFNKISSLISESLLWKLLVSCNNKLNNLVDHSLFVNICIKPDSLDCSYNDKKSLSAISKFLKKICLPLHNKILSSTIYNNIVSFCKNLQHIPLLYIGITLAFWGIFSVLYCILNHVSGIWFVLSITILALGVLFLILKSEINVLITNSVICTFTCKIFGIQLPEINSSDYAQNFKVPVILGILLAGATFIFGISTTSLAVALFITIVFGFYFTKYAAIIYVCILPFASTMIMVAGGLALFGCILVKTLLGFNESIHTDRHPANMFLLFYAIAFGIAAVFSSTKTSSIKITLVYIAFLCAAYAIIKLLSTKSLLVSVLNGLSLLSIPVSIFGIYQHFTGFDEQNTWIDTEMFEEISGRVVSFFGNPNVFGEYLILIILTALACFFISKNNYIKLIHLIAVAFAGVSLIFTYSRGCWIGTIFAIIIFLFMNKRKYFIAFCFLGLCSVFFLPDSIITRFMSVGNLADSSTSYRVYIWEGTINMLRDFWITGIGLGSDAFNTVYPVYAYSAISAPHPHNLYLLILTETGLVGCIAFVFIILFYYKRLLSVIKTTQDSNIKTISCALIAAVSGYLLQGMFDNVWYNYRVFLLFWIYIALGVIVDIVSRREINEQN